MNGQGSEHQHQLPYWQIWANDRLVGGNQDQPDVQAGSQRIRGNGRDKGTAMREQKRDKNYGVPDFPTARNEPDRLLQTDGRPKIRRAADGKRAWVEASCRLCSFGCQRDFHPHTAFCLFVRRWRARATGGGRGVAPWSAGRTARWQIIPTRGTCSAARPAREPHLSACHLLAAGGLLLVAGRGCPSACVPGSVRGARAVPRRWCGAIFTLAQFFHSIPAFFLPGYCLLPTRLCYNFS